jgi:hypothetical protein
VVPGSAFVDAKGRKVTRKVRLELIEVIDPLDFVTADVDLTFYPERGGREMFQSAGMFRVNAHELSGWRGFSEARPRESASSSRISAPAKNFLSTATMPKASGSCTVITSKVLAMHPEA